MPKYQPRRRSSLPLSPATMVATLDLTQPQERAAHDLLRRFCTGRWPLWRLLGLRREEHTLYAAVEWQRCRRPARFAVAELSLDEPAVCWRCFPRATAVRRALNELVAGTCGASRPATERPTP